MTSAVSRMESLPQRLTYLPPGSSPGPADRFSPHLDDRNAGLFREVADKGHPFCSRPILADLVGRAVDDDVGPGQRQGVYHRVTNSGYRPAVFPPGGAGPPPGKRGKQASVHEVPPDVHVGIPVFFLQDLPPYRAHPSVHVKVENLVEQGAFGDPDPVREAVDRQRPVDVGVVVDQFTKGLFHSPGDLGIGIPLPQVP